MSVQDSPRQQCFVAHWQQCLVAPCLLSLVAQMAVQLLCEKGIVQKIYDLLDETLERKLGSPCSSVAPGFLAQMQEFQLNDPPALSDLDYVGFLGEQGLYVHPEFEFPAGESGAGYQIQPARLEAIMAESRQRFELQAVECRSLGLRNLADIYLDFSRCDLAPGQFYSVDVDAAGRCLWLQSTPRAPPGQFYTRAAEPVPRALSPILEEQL